MNDRFLKALDRAVAVASRHEQFLLTFPGVVTVGAGPERKNGKITGEAAVVVTVRNKTSPKELEREGKKQLPSRLDGVAVDVIELGRPVEAPKIVKAQAKAAQVLALIKDKWLASENVTAIGVGYKTAGGVDDFKTVAIKFFVRRKLPRNELRRLKIAPIPTRISGIPTDVDEMAPLRPVESASGSRTDRKDPLVGGIALGVNTRPFSYGTLGAIVFDRTTGEKLVLSNQHVLDAPPDTAVVQPSPIGLDDSLDIGFQLDICNPVHFFRLDTPNTTVGSVLAGAAVAAATAAALSDEIDPTRRGQRATPPHPGARTLSEHHQVRFTYPELPTPGTHFGIKTAWQYTRHTDRGDLAHSIEETRTNPHALVDKLVLTDKAHYAAGETIRLYALILPEQCASRLGDRALRKQLSVADLRRMTKVDSTVRTNFSERLVARAQGSTSDGPPTWSDQKCRCDRYHVTAILTPTAVDQAFPIVLREPTSDRKYQLLAELLANVKRRGDAELVKRVSLLVRAGCFYSGELLASGVPLGPWKHYLFVQTANYATSDMDPTKAAQIIGGLYVSQNTKPQVDVACGAAVFEDGQFDIELI